ncbi:MAG: hypothetical protein WC333_04340 [Dehalococcoidia bacterium]|jgi:hypothetical protein
MESFDLAPTYSTGDIPGKCIKCLAEKELFSCLRTLLLEADKDEEAARKYEVLLEFLKSPSVNKLIDETEKLLSEGKEVSVNLYVEAGEPKYRLKVK